MFVYRSNRTEVLVEQLAQVVRQPVGAVTESECIVVQGPGMQRWLTLMLAERLGIWANPQFPFPRTVIGNAVSAVLQQEVQTVFEPTSLFWAVAAQLEAEVGARLGATQTRALQNETAYAPIVNYLRGDDSGRKLFQLAERVAKTFDRYALYRPELVSGWEQGQGNDFQACLWRSVVQAHDNQHVANQLQQFLEKVNASDGPIPGFPRRLCLFGISALPPQYTRALAALAQRIPVHLFVLSPSREYWGDVERKGPLEMGNPLLTSLGKLAGDFQQVLEEQAPGYQETADDLYVEPVGHEGESSAMLSRAVLSPTMLSTLQSDMLALRHRRESLPLLPEDQSVSIHSCHSPLRELEVLHDQLVARFDSTPSLLPRDVIVMAPNVESYAPLIDAVFGTDTSDRPRIPYRISDRSDSSTAPVLLAYAQVLETLKGRKTASQLMDLLSLACVRDKFAIAESELPQIRKWIVDSGIRWGVDASARGAVEQPEMQENTWRFGLDRLLLGYAMEGHERLQFAGVLPFDDMEGSVTETLGRLLEFCETLFSYQDALSEPKEAKPWATLLLEILDSLIVLNEDNANEHQLVREATVRIAKGAESGGFAGKIPFETIVHLLEDSWQQGDSVRGFLSGGVTFCQLMPMRSIPFQIVCVLGMSDGQFPRSPAPLGFDLVAANPKIGDRTPRDEDRYLFLEAILSARTCLLLTYVGQSIQNNGILPPSVLVGELLEVLEESFEVDNGSVHEAVVVQHPLQPFSPRYFASANVASANTELAEVTSPRRLFSYSEVYCEGARSLGVSRQTRAGFLTDSIAPADESEREVSLNDLVKFYRHPVKFWMERRLGLFLPDIPEALEDREPMSLSGLEGYGVGKQLLGRAVIGEDVSEAFPSLRAAGRLPLGMVGQCAVQGLLGEVGEIAQRVFVAREGDGLSMAGLPGLPVSLKINGTHLVGAVEQLWPGGRVLGAYNRPGGSAELGHWIRHLVLCALAPADIALRTVLVVRGDSKGKLGNVVFGEVSEPLPILEQLLSWYWAGQQAPLPFFCGAAQEFAAKLKGVPVNEAEPSVFDEALVAAYVSFRSDGLGSAENENSYTRRAFDTRYCLDADYVPFENLPKGYCLFPQLAAGVYQPMLRAREVIPV